MHSFLLGLNGKSVQRELEYRMLWIETKCGKFFVKSLYKALESGPSASFSLNVIWKSCVQPKVSFSGRKQLGGRLLLWTNFKKEDGL